jgi:hypothetical protein
VVAEVDGSKEMIQFGEAVHKCCENSDICCFGTLSTI